MNARMFRLFVLGMILAATFLASHPISGTADGYDMPGSIGSSAGLGPVTPAGGGSSGVEMETFMSWSTLGFSGPQSSSDIIELDPTNDVDADSVEFSQNGGATFEYIPIPDFAAEIGFHVEDFDEVHGRVTQAGVSVVQEPRDEPWGKTARYLDPDGNIVGIATTITVNARIQRTFCPCATR